ncbi:MAG: hypothetical protein AAFN30_11605, partial [Actinomycetota bacterium]
MGRAGPRRWRNVVSDGPGEGGRNRRGVPLAAIGPVLAVVIAAIVVLGGPGATAAGAVIEDPDIDSTADYRYSINLERGVVEARIAFTVTADKPNVTTDDRIFQYFYRGYNVLIPAEAEELGVVDQSGVELVHERTRADADSDDSDIVAIDFRRNIFFGQSARFTVSFVLPAGSAGSDNIARVNPAYASFVAWTSPIIEEATVTIVVPPGFDDRSTGPQPFAAEREADEQLLVATNIDPETYYAVVSVANDDALEDDVVSLADGLLAPELTAGAASNVRVRSWPGDEAWRLHVIEGVERGLPRLVELVGRPWPITDELTITESFSPYLYGYAGWYDPETDVIEVGDERDEHVLYHEISHVWFNRDLFVERWITEGLADFYAAETVASLGGTRPEPRATAPTDREAIPLSRFDRPDSPEAERWGYSASWTLMEQVVDEIGIDGLAAVVEAAEEKHQSYPGDGEPETVATVADWRRFLDLVENEQEVVAGPVTDLIEDWVLDDERPDPLGPDVLDDRAEARRRYFDLAATGDSWAPPADVREAMMLWRFPKAETLMTESAVLLAERDAILATIAPTGAELPDTLEPSYEAIDRDRDRRQLTTALAETDAAADELRQAHDLAQADRSILQRIGLLGADVEQERAEAVAAFGSGRLAVARAEADEVDELINGANRAGGYRVGAVVVVVAVVAAGAWWLLMRPRRRPRPGPAIEAPACPITLVAPASSDVSCGWDHAHRHDQPHRSPEPVHRPGGGGRLPPALAVVGAEHAPQGAPQPGPPQPVVPADHGRPAGARTHAAAGARRGRRPVARRHRRGATHGRPLPPPGRTAVDRRRRRRSAPVLVSPLAVRRRGAVHDGAVAGWGLCPGRQYPDRGRVPGAGGGGLPVGLGRRGSARTAHPPRRAARRQLVDVRRERDVGGQLAPGPGEPRRHHARPLPPRPIDHPQRRGHRGSGDRDRPRHRLRGPSQEPGRGQLRLGRRPPRS